MENYEDCEKKKGTVVIGSITANVENYENCVKKKGTIVIGNITANVENYEDCEKKKGTVVIGGGLPDFKNLSEGTLKGPYTSVKCRSLRIGSYKVMPTERILFVPEGISIRIPPIFDGNKKEMITIDIPVKKIVKILAHFGRTLPVFFVYVKPSLGSTIRTALKMTDKSGAYFDPCSLDESQKRITILLDKVMEDKAFFKRLFNPESKSTSIAAYPTLNLANINLSSPLKVSSSTSSHCILDEINQQEANEILIRSSPEEVQNTIKKGSIGAVSEVNTLIIYPPAPMKGGISVTTDDYVCLEEEQYLNDVIMDFYLKWLLQSKLSETDKQQTHVFSTFFYKRLTSKPKKGRRPHPIEDDPNLSSAEKRHARVKSWTKNVDIFSKDYIIVPINEHSHWFLAVICYPGLDEPVHMSDDTPVSRNALMKSEKITSTQPKNKIETLIIDDGEWSDRDEAEGDDEELEEEDDADEFQPPFKKLKTENNSCPSPTPSTATTTTTMITTAYDTIAQTADSSAPADPIASANIPPTPKLEHDNKNLAVRQPCILIFDSLSGANRSRIVATLRDYLTVEYKTHKKVEKPFTRDTMKGACPKVPQQQNYSDCGIFTLQFAESFFEHPLKDYTFPIRTLVEWFPQEVVQSKREAIAKLIKSLMEIHNPNHASIELPDISFASNNKLPDISFASQQYDKAFKFSISDESIDSQGMSASNSAVKKGLVETSDNEINDNATKSNVKEENSDDPRTLKIDRNVDTVNAFHTTQPGTNNIAKKDQGVLPNIKFSLQEKISCIPDSRQYTSNRTNGNLIINNTRLKDDNILRI